MKKLNIYTSLILTSLLSLVFVLAIAIEHKLPGAETFSFGIIANSISKNQVNNNCENIEEKNIIEGRVNNKNSTANYANGYYASAGAYFINDPKAWAILD